MRFSSSPNGQASEIGCKIGDSLVGGQYTKIGIFMNMESV